MTQSEAQKQNVSVVIPLTEISGTVLALTKTIVGAGCPLVIVQTEQAHNAEDQQSLKIALQNLGADVCCSLPSRGGQIARGIAQTDTDWIWVLHGDSCHVKEALSYLVGLTRANAPGWGRFDINLLGGNPVLALIGFFMNLRSRWTGICTGDQGMFFHRGLLQGIGGFPDQRLMEDIEVSRRLRGKGVFLAPKIRISTSGERWERDGILRTVLGMWRWRLRYFFGASADQLYTEYYGAEDGQAR